MLTEIINRLIGHYLSLRVGREYNGLFDKKSHIFHVMSAPWLENNLI